jgi:hypothetical protein
VSEALPPALAAHLQARSPLAARLLVWIEGRDRDTGAVQPIGVWTGAGDLEVTVSGAQRTYRGGGAVIEIAPIQSLSDLSVQMQRVVLSALAPAVELAIRGTDPRLVPIEIHALHRDPVDRGFLGLDRLFRGRIDKTVIEFAGENEEATVTITAASHARRLTRGLSLKRSDESQRLRQGDRWARYAAVGLVRSWWGQERPDD